MYRILSTEEKKKLEAPLLLGTTYSLNYSGTKKISSGLQPRVNGDIVPIIVLQNNNSSGGIVFESTAWSKLQTGLDDIGSYFTGGYKNYGWKTDLLTPKPLKIEDVEVFFTTAFGSKSIVFDRPMEESNTEDVNGGDDENTPLEPPQKKKKRHYSPAIVMQKTSFDGLCNVTVCVEERFRRLQRHATHVKKCADYLCGEILLHIPATEQPGNMDETRVKELLTQNSESLRDAVRRRIDPSFLEHFDILFLELKVFCIPFITNELKKLLRDVSLIATSPM